MFGFWVYGVYMPGVIYNPETDRYEDAIYGEGLDETKAMVHVSNESVGMFTNKLDKDGKRIFEGDIIKRKIVNKEYDGYGNIQTGCVFYDIHCAAFKIAFLDGEGLRTKQEDYFVSHVLIDGKVEQEIWYEYEVIGNIYDKH